jgi:hypothetical protein
MRRLIVLIAAANIICFGVAISKQQTDRDNTGPAIKVAMGPVSAPQKRGPPVASPNPDPHGCKRPGRTCPG